MFHGHEIDHGGTEPAQALGKSVHLVHARVWQLKMDAWGVLTSQYKAEQPGWHGVHRDMTAAILHEK